MVFINGHWENVDNLNDVSNIIRDSFNTDLADAMDKLLTKMDKLLTKMEQKSDSLEEELGDEIDDLHDIIEEQAADIETLEDALSAVFKELRNENLFNGTLRSLEAKMKQKGFEV